MSSIRGLQKTTLIDYPGEMACTIFFSGCNLYCPFCHNKDLVLQSDVLPRFTEQKILDFLKSRKGILEGVVLTGGEPLLDENLREFIRGIKNLGFLVKLDTNGVNSRILKDLINQRLIDYVAMDFKAPIDKYEKAVGVRINKKAILESMNFLISGKVVYEFRTTVVPTIHLEEDLIKMAEQLKDLTLLSYKLHATSYTLNWFLQPFRPGRCLDPKFNKLKPYPKTFYDKILPKLQKIIPSTFLRGL